MTIMKQTLTFPKVKVYLQNIYLLNIESWDPTNIFEYYKKKTENKPNAMLQRMRRKEAKHIQYHKEKKKEKTGKMLAEVFLMTNTEIF